MSNLSEKLLQPIPGDKPCGPDLSYDPRLDAIEQLLKGQPEVEMGAIVKPAEPPDWPALKAACVDFLGASKHLRPAVILCAALLKTDGLPGFSDGLRVVRGLVEQFWAQFYPLLDPEDRNDPQQRLNLVGALTAPRLSVTGWLQILDFLHKAPLCRPRGLPPVTLDDLVAAKKKESGGAESGGITVDAGQVNRAFQSASADEIRANHTAVTESLESLAGLDGFLTSTLGSGGAINFDDLRGLLEQIERLLSARMAGGTDAAAAAGGPMEGMSATPAGGFAGVPVPSGAIRTREDVCRALDGICESYRQVEPGSPVPLLLRRAQKLATMNFVEAMQELNLATPDQLRPAMGSAVEPAAS